MKTTVMTRNYDMNIWDELEYESWGEASGAWKINFYPIPQVGIPYGGSGQWLEKYDFFITDEEAKMLTLGWGQDLGGYHCEDSDFFIDIETFKTIYKEIPERLLRHFEILPEYEQSTIPWEPFAKLAG